MSKILNLRMKGKQLVTSFGILQFDANGITDLPEEQAKELLSIKGFELADDTLKNFDSKSTESLPVINPSAEDENTQEGDENTQEDEPSEETSDFDKMTVPQLKKYAKDHNIDLMGANKKDEIIPLIVGSDK